MKPKRERKDRAFKAECVRQEDLYTCQIWPLAHEDCHAACCPLIFSLHLFRYAFPFFTHTLPLAGRASRHLAGSLVLTEMPKLFLFPISKASPRSCNTR